jgi:hypothetical protein
LRIEIFVVTTELNRNIATHAYWTELEALKAEMIREFGGLTETGTETGYWNDNGEICADTVKRWLIYADLSKSLEKQAHEAQIIENIGAFAKRIKEITAQKSQAFGIDGKLYLV